MTPPQFQIPPQMAVPWQLVLADLLLLEASGCAFAAIRDDGSVITWGDEAWNLELLLPFVSDFPKRSLYEPGPGKGDH